MNIASETKKVNKLDRIYKTLIVFIISWVLAMQFVNNSRLHINYERIEDVIEQQTTIRQDIIDIKTRALSALTNQAVINLDVQDQLDKQ